MASGVVGAWGSWHLRISSTSKDFLVAWQTPEHTVKAALINLAGTAISAPVLLSPGMGRDPSVTWNPATNEFGVAFSGETYSGFAAVPAWNSAAFRRNTFNVGGGKLTAMTDIAYNPASGRYVMAWYEISSGNFAKVAEFDASGALMSHRDRVRPPGLIRRIFNGPEPGLLYVPDGRTRSSLRYGAGHWS